MKLPKDVIVIGNSKKIINILYEIYYNSNDDFLMKLINLLCLLSY